MGINDPGLGSGQGCGVVGALRFEQNHSNNIGEFLHRESIQYRDRVDAASGNSVLLSILLLSLLTLIRIIQLLVYYTIVIISIR